MVNLDSSQDNHEDRESAGPAARQAGGAGHFWQRLSFWRALSGMGITFAIAAGIVTVEFSSAMVHRTHYTSRRIGHLIGETHRLKRALDAKDRKVARLSAAAARDSSLKQVLTAPDLRIVRMRAVNAGANAAPEKGAGEPAAVIAISIARDSAVLEAGGLEHLPLDRVYGVWWIPRGGQSVAAGQFRVAAARTATVTLAMPPKGIVSAAIFEQDITASRPPHGAPILRSAPIEPARR